MSTQNIGNHSQSPTPENLDTHLHVSSTKYSQNIMLNYFLFLYVAFIYLYFLLCVLIVNHSVMYLVTSHSPQRPGFYPRPVQVGYVVDKVELGQMFLYIHWFYPASYHSTNSINFHQRHIILSTASNVK